MTLTPAFVVGKYLEYIAWNPLAGELLLGLEDMQPHEPNYARLLFADPRMQDFYPDWEHMARIGVGLLRMQSTGNPHNPRLTQLVGELSVGYPLFRQWWADRRVISQDCGRKTIINGHLFLPIRGHLFSPLVATNLPTVRG